jgi:cytoskeleton protein RodZ
MTTELTQPTSAVPALSAGQILRQAREQQNLTTAQVALQLNLSKSLIDDLELDQVDAKLSSTFVRGYLRSYAKLLKLPVQQVLDAYSSNSKGLHQVPSLTRSFSKRTAKEATENRFMWVTYFVIAVFVVLLVLGFWQSRFGSSGAGTALPMAQTDATMLASEEAQQAEMPGLEPAGTAQNTIPVTQLDHSPTATDTAALITEAPANVTTDIPALAVPQQVESQTATPAVTDAASTAALAASNTVTPAATTPTSLDAVPSQNSAEIPTPSTVPANSVPQVATTVTQPGADVVTTDSAVTEAAVTTSTAVSTPVDTAVTTPVDTAANATVSLSLNAECWVDVVDATGKRLVFGSRKAGEQLNLRGVAPIKVLLGNAAAATLSFNGAAIDLSGYPTGRVARLTLGQN